MNKESHHENKVKRFRICRPRSNKNSEMAANTVFYDDFEPSTHVIQDNGCETIIFNLPDFRKDQLRVQLTSANILRITGTRPITENKMKRFKKEISVSHNCIMHEISAKFEGGKLYIKLPKLIVEEKPETKLTPPLEKPADNLPQAQKQPTPEEETSQKTASGGDSSKPITAQDNVTSAINTGKAPNDAKNGNHDGTEKKPSIAQDEEKDKQTANKTAKRDATRSIDKYKETGSSVASKLKMPRRVTSVVLAVILAVSLVLYISKLISSCKVDVICT